jgi:hypothetical protein
MEAVPYCGSPCQGVNKKSITAESSRLITVDKATTMDTSLSWYTIRRFSEHSHLC